MASKDSGAEMVRGKTVILGIGNILLKDEGIGVHVIREMREIDLPDGVELVEGGTSSLDLPLYIKEAQKLIIIDAFQGGKSPGTIYRCTPEDLMAKRERPTSLHDVGPLEAFQMAKRLGYKPATVIIGVEPAAIEWGMDLSPKITGKMTKIIDAVLKEI